MSGVRPATAEAFRLAEGPVWDADRGRLLWVDIPAGLVCEGTLSDAGQVVRIDRRQRLPGTVGAVAPTADGGLLLATQEHLQVVAADGTRTDGPRIVPRGRSWRCNDGGTDPGGRFLVGTLALAGPTAGQILVRLEPDGRLTVLDDDLELSNGLAWSSDGQTMYSVDSLRRTVFARSYDPHGESVGPRRIHLTLDDGLPDGITVDAQDHLWVAVWGAGHVRRYAPDGRLVERVPVPAPHPTSVALAGAELRTLVISTAAGELSPDQLTTYPEAGRLFTVRVDVPGLPTVPWSGAPIDSEKPWTEPTFAAGPPTDGSSTHVSDASG